ncbi:MAG: hypothetical protein HYW50_00975 [Candidatus Diapherotrites archaeon]|nr:hypothetical protein [Candidatus Diapherotrites archaeon]
MATVPFSKWLELDLRTAKIIEVHDIEGKDKLYRLELEVGKEKRTLVAGLKDSYSKEELAGKTVVLFSNLEPKKIAGIESQGMLLAATDKLGKPIILTTDKKLESGLKIM